MQILFQRVRFILLRQFYFTASILFYCVNFISLRQFYFTASILFHCVNFMSMRQFYFTASRMWWARSWRTNWYPVARASPWPTKIKSGWMDPVQKNISCFVVKVSEDGFKFRPSCLSFKCCCVHWHSADLFGFLNIIVLKAFLKEFWIGGGGAKSVRSALRLNFRSTKTVLHVARQKIVYVRSRTGLNLGFA
jgi:hypothetical protein